MGNWEASLTIKNVGNASYATYGGYGYTTIAGGTGASSYYYYGSDPRSAFISAKYSFN